MEKFEPSSFWDKKDGIDTLHITTTGFKRENLKVQVDTSGNLRVSGDGGEGGRQFSKTYNVPEGCDLRLIRARFESDSSTLVITFPKAAAGTAAGPAAGPVDKTEPQKADKKENGDRARQRLGMWAPGRDKLVYTFVFVLVLLLAGACFYLSYELRKAAAAKKIVMVVPE